MAKPGWGDLRANLTYPFYRSLIRIPEPPLDLCVRMATSRADWIGALSLVHDTHVELGWLEPQPHGIAPFLHHALPHTTVLIAELGSQIIGTVSITRQNDMGLPLEMAYPDSRRQPPGMVVAEVHSLAIKPEYRKHGSVAFPLFRAIYALAKEYLRVSALQIAVAPEHEDFYSSILGFEPMLDNYVRDPLVGSSPVKPLFLHLEDGRKWLRRHYANRAAHANLFHYFIENRPDWLKLPEPAAERVIYPTLDFESAKLIFTTMSSVFAHASQRDLEIFRELYQGSELLGLLEESPKTTKREVRRRARRFPVALRAFFETNEGDFMVKLLDVSETGFRLVSRFPLRLKEDYDFRVRIASGQSILITARPIWNRHRREWGFLIQKPPLGWREFLKHLDVSAPTVRAA